MLTKQGVEDAIQESICFLNKWKDSDRKQNKLVKDFTSVLKQAIISHCFLDNYRDKDLYKRNIEFKVGFNEELELSYIVPMSTDTMKRNGVIQKQFRDIISEIDLSKFFKKETSNNTMLSNLDFNSILNIKF